MSLKTVAIRRGEKMCYKVYIRTFGCQMNVRDSEILAGALIKKGMLIVDDWEDADVILFNTCAVRKHAEDRVFSILGLIAKKIKTHKQKKLIGLIGCMAQEWKDKAFKKAPYLDIVCGPNDIYTLIRYLPQLVESKQKALFVDSEKRADEFYSDGAYFSKDPEHSFVIIMEGCNNFCSYCIVPYVRGRERSRPSKDILYEINLLIKMGKSRFTLLGQNVNSYVSDILFIDLLRRVSDIKGVRELSFVTCHPKDANIELFKVMVERENIKRFLHLPFQSGSNRILKLMNRGYTIEHYIELIDAFRCIVPNGKLSTDVIVGFPTETEEDFLATKNVLEKVRFSSAYIFKYSPRPYSSASRFKDDVPREEKERRHNILLELQKRISSFDKETSLG